MSRKLNRTFLREWRKHRDKTLQAVAEEIGITHGQLSRIERGEQPYNQELLEKLSEIYQCDPVDMLIRNPADPEAIWSIWDRAQPGEREQIARVASAIVDPKGRTGTTG